MPQIKRQIGGFFGKWQLPQDALGVGQRQFGIDPVVFAGWLQWSFGNARNFGHENQLVGMQLAGDRGGHVLHIQVERFASGRKTQGRKQHNRALIKQLLNQRCINLANQSGVLIVDPIDNAHGPGGDEIARYDFHHRASHGCVGQCLTEGGFHFVAQLASRFQHAIQRHRIGNAYAIVVAGRMPLDRKLFVDLWTEPIDQDDLQAHAVDQRQVLHDIGQLACCNGLARYTGDQRLSAVHVDVGRNGSEPRHKGEIENGGHRLAAGAGGLWVARYCACICRVCCVGNGRGK